jgi:hypothetical protein
MMYWKTKLGDCSLFRGLGTNVSNLLSTATRMTWSNFLSQVRLFLYVLWFNQVSCIMEVSEILRSISYILEKVAFRCARNCQVNGFFYWVLKSWRSSAIFYVNGCWEETCSPEKAMFPSLWFKRFTIVPSFPREYLKQGRKVFLACWGT